MELVEEAQSAETEGGAATESVGAPATETVASAPGEGTEEKPEVVVKKEEEGEVKKEDGSTEEAKGDGEQKDETATATIEVERAGPKLSRIEEEPEVETTGG